MPRKKKVEKVKNLNGMGSMRQLANGKYEYRFTMPERKPDGSLDRRSVTADDGPAAMARARDIMNAYNPSDTGVNIDPNSLTLEALFEKWWLIHSKSVRGSTLSTDRFTKQRIINSLGQMLAKDIKAAHINAHTQKQLEDGLSDKTASKDRGMLYQVFEYAVEDEILEQNPVKKKAVRKPRETELAVDKSDAYSPDEVEKIIEAQARLSEMKGVRGIAPSLIQAAEATVVWLFSGVREGELLNLSADMIDENGKSLTIINSLNIVEGKPVPGPTKSSAGMRKAEVSRIAQPVLASMKKTASNNRLFKSRNTKTKYYGASGLRDAYDAFIYSIPGIRRLPPNCCRHTHATMLAAANVPPALIQYQMGHADYQLTAAIYTHVKLYMTPEAIKKIKSWGVGEFYWANIREPLEMAENIPNASPMNT